MKRLHGLTARRHQHVQVPMLFIEMLNDACHVGAEFFAEIGHVQGLPAHVIGVAFIGWPRIARHDPHEDGCLFRCFRPFSSTCWPAVPTRSAHHCSSSSALRLYRVRGVTGSDMRRAAGQPCSLTDHLSCRQLSLVRANPPCCPFGWPRLPRPNGKDLCMHELNPTTTAPFQGLTGRTSRTGLQPLLPLHRPPEGP